MFTFSRFSCNYPVCCVGAYDLTYKIAPINLTSGHDWKVIGLNETVGEEFGKMVVRPLDKSKLTTFNFFVYAENTIGSFNFSEELTLKIVP